MPEITDDYMRGMLAKTKSYTAMLLRVTEKVSQSDSREIIWEHGRRNFALKADGKLPDRLTRRRRERLGRHRHLRRHPRGSRPDHGR